MLWGKVCRISPIFFRTWYQISGISLDSVSSLIKMKIIDSPGLEKLDE